MSKKQEAKKSNRYAQLFWLLVFVVVIQIAYGITVRNQIPTLAQSGLFGDTFGALTALFSGLAFAGMIFAILLQKDELSMQRTELELQRKELKLTRDVLDKSAEAQTELVDKQLLTAKIAGMSAIVQGRYQYISAFGHNADRQLPKVKEAESQLIDLLKEAGHDCGIEPMN